MPTAFKTGSQVASSGNLTDVDTVARNPLGSSVEGNDSFNAKAEFVYLQGCAGTIAGTVVTYDEAGLTSLIALNAVGPVAVALAPCVAGTFGWYAVRGTFPVDVVASCADNAKLGIETTSGKVGDGCAVGDAISGMVSRAATTTAAIVMCQLMYPSVNDTSA